MKSGHIRARYAGVALAAGSVLMILAAVAALVFGTVQAAADIALPLPSPSLPPLPTALPTVLPTQLPPPPVTPPAPPTINLPVATPTLPVPTPSLPIGVGTPTPSLPGVLDSPTPSPSAGAPGGPAGGGGSHTTAGPGGSHGGPPKGIPLPFGNLVIQSPLDVALLATIAALPLLLGIWLLAFGRTWTEARRSRDAQIRLAISNELGMSPRELVSVTTKGLFKLREQAAFDELTGVLRRAAGISALDREISRSRRQRSPLSVAFVDVDGLKQANDQRGHKAGDELLRNLASTLQSALRGQDLVVRYGGDEFVCVLPDTVADAARAKLSWIQTEVQKTGINFSSGVAQLERTDDVVSLLGRADTEMYAVKSRRGVIRDLRLGVVDGSRPATA